MAAEVSDKIYNYISALYGKESADKYLAFIEKETTQYIRVNTSRIGREELSNIILKKYQIKTERVNNFENVLKVTAGQDRIGKTIEHVLGFYYIQSLSSMLPPVALNPDSNNVVMDLCGAPGSKSTQLAELMENKGTLIINEADNERVKSLIFNLERMNVINSSVIRSKGEVLSKIYNEYFTKVLVDAPCSGLGIIQKKGEVSNWWSLDHVQRLQQLQIRLLVSAIKMARAGAEIVYSTCTLSVEENEIVIDKILEKYPVKLEQVNLPIASRPGFTEYGDLKFNPELKKAIRVLPWEIDSDGFFLVKMIKTEKTEANEREVPHLTDYKIAESNHKIIKPYLDYVSEHFGVDKKILDDYKFIFRGKDIFFITKDWHDENAGLFNRIGLKFGTLDKKDRITLNSQAAQVLEKHITKFVYQLKDDDELLKYLTGWKIKDVDISSGQYVVKYNNRTLGTAIMTSEGLKSRFPRTKRTQRFDF
ncbi:MAG: RsmB/NOP family class I SAM-dependent RNA methyltransferase [Ignavibacteriaceae bacterium]|jgi:16S rRNA (cytosine1407-C5)-methyltransferase|nr:RsmB/NOP family class I SAM-dependent RNA methyltransferase [Ignavibacteriaceae bacterium]